MNRFTAIAFAFLALSACSQEPAAEKDPAGTSDPGTGTAIDPTPIPPSPVAKNADDKLAERAALQSSIPERFHGTYAASPGECDVPSHGLFTVKADEIKFFESTGIVRNTRADGPYAAATVFEQYGDSPGSTYAFYMRILPDGSLRYRYDDNERLTWVRCP